MLPYDSRYFLLLADYISMDRECKMHFDFFDLSSFIYEILVYMSYKFLYLLIRHHYL